MTAQLQTALRMIYPPRCLGCGTLVESDFALCGPCWRDTPFIAGAVCESCGAPQMGQRDGFRLECDDCMKMPRPWSDGRAALLYRDAARALVLRLKHADRTDLAAPAAAWMVRAGREILKPNMLVVPVPLHWSRLMKRRYNQAALLAQAVADQAGLAWCPDLLKRFKRTRTLDGKSAQQRFETLSGSLSLNSKRRHRIAGRHVLIVDDVMTSGATLAEATRVCRANGANDVSVLILARVAKDA